MEPKVCDGTLLPDPMLDLLDMELESAAEVQRESLSKYKSSVSGQTKTKKRKFREAFNCQCDSKTATISSKMAYRTGAFNLLSKGRRTVHVIRHN